MQLAWWVKATINAVGTPATEMRRWSSEERLVFRLIVVFALAIYFLVVLWSLYMRLKWLLPIVALVGYPFGLWVARCVCELLWPKMVAKADQNAAIRMHKQIYGPSET
jgi:hypothetical protein